jgi:PhnB protein
MQRSTERIGDKSIEFRRFRTGALPFLFLMLLVAPVTQRKDEMNSIQPELWVDNPREAISFYETAFGAKTLHRVGEGDDVVAQLGVGDAVFWVAAASSCMKRLSPRSISGATSRMLLIVEEPAAVLQRAVAAGATETTPVRHEHGWLVGRIVDVFGHEWEIGKPVVPWPPFA